MASLFDSQRFDSLLSTAHIGRELHYFESVETTMTIARDLAAAGASHGAIVLAEEQTAGRGRRGRGFHSPPGENLYFTLVLRLSHEAVRSLPLAVPVAVCAAIEPVEPRARVKWPNDIWIDGLKTCGMLIDLDDAGNAGFIGYPGIGINVNGDPTLNPDLKGIATSVRVSSGQQVDREALLARVCNTLEAALTAWTATQLAEEYRARSLVLGRRVTVTGAGESIEGTAAAIRDDGSLVLRLDDGTDQTVNAGDVSLRPA